MVAANSFGAGVSCSGAPLFVFGIMRLNAVRTARRNEMATTKNKPASAIGAVEEAKADQVEEKDDALVMSDEPAPNKKAFDKAVGKAVDDFKAKFKARPATAAADNEAVEHESDEPTLIMSKEESGGREDFRVEASAPEQFDAQIKPSFANLDESGLHDWFQEMTTYLRGRGAIVNALDVQAIGTMVEAKYQWRYQEDHPVTVVAAAGSGLEAARLVAEEVSARRHEV